MYSPTSKITAPQLAGAMRDMLQASGKFLGVLPVDRYVFLFDFAPVAEGDATGAWEHSYSSAYTLRGGAVHPRGGRPHHVDGGTRVLSHRDAAPSAFGDRRALRLSASRSLSPPVAVRGCDRVGRRRSCDRKEASVARAISRRARGEGAARSTAVRYDVLAHRSGAYVVHRSRRAAVRQHLHARRARRGTARHPAARAVGRRARAQSLVLDLSRDYGVSRPFPEDSLIDIVVARTHPEIRDFFARWVQGAEPLPLREYYGKLGIALEVEPAGRTDEARARSGRHARAAKAPRGVAPRRGAAAGRSRGESLRRCRSESVRVPEATSADRDAALRVRRRRCRDFSRTPSRSPPRCSSRRRSLAASSSDGRAPRLPRLHLRPVDPGARLEGRGPPDDDRSRDASARRRRT